MRSLPSRALPASVLPRVSVVVPCYNYGEYLRACVESVLTQPGVDVDVTIVDDASTDDSVAVAEQLMAESDRVALIHHETNRGHIQTFNDALAAATAEFVVKMDADDIVPEGALARAVALLAAQPQLAFVYGHPHTFVTDPPADLATEVRDWTVWDGEEWAGAILDRAHNVIMQPEVVMRRSALEEVGGHREEVPEASDLNLWLRLASAGGVGRVNGPVQGLYRVHAKSMQRTVHAGFLSDLNGRVAAIELFFAERGATLRDATGLQRRFRRAMALDAVGLARRAQDLGRADVEPIAEYLQTARTLDPHIIETRQWRAANRRSSASRPRAAIRGLDDRLRWRKWRRTGL